MVCASMLHLTFWMLGATWRHTAKEKPQAEGIKSQLLFQPSLFKKPEANHLYDVELS